MGFHKVPENLDPLDVSVVEGVAVTIVSITLDHLLAHVTPSPQLTHPAVAAVHVGGVLPGLRVAVHVLSDLGDVVHLDMVIPTIIGNHSVVRAGAQIGWQIWREWDGVVIEAMEINDADRGVRHGVVASEGGGAHWTNGGHSPSQPRHDPGPDEHPAIGGS